jgi:hypothetical protein
MSSLPCDRDVEMSRQAAGQESLAKTMFLVRRSVASTGDLVQKSHTTDRLREVKRCEKKTRSQPAHVPHPSLG